MKVITITNNPVVKEYFIDKAIEYTSTNTLMEVLEKGRDLVHKGYRLINHPLVTSIKPYPNLFKTLILVESQELSFRDLEIMENSIQKASQFKEPVRITEQVARDYQEIDYGVFIEAQKEIQFK